jgi:hypothetical protein
MGAPAAPEIQHSPLQAPKLQTKSFYMISSYTMVFPSLNMIANIHVLIGGCQKLSPGVT